MNTVYSSSQNDFYPTLQDAINAERCNYINDHTYTDSDRFFGSAPRQFNINIARSEYTDDPEKKIYAVEFFEEEGHFVNATTWLSGDDAVDIFVSCDASKIELDSYEEDWIEQV